MGSVKHCVCSCSATQESLALLHVIAQDNVVIRFSMKKILQQR